MEGEKLEVIDTTTGEIKKAEVFVAILGASQLTYVEAVESQSLEDFILCCENALHFFSGAPSAKENKAEKKKCQKKSAIYLLQP